MILFPISKINLGLHVLRKRDDGFHDLSTCFYPLGWKDILEIIPGKKVSFTTTGLEIKGNQEDNLCLKAYNLLKADYNLPPVQIHLHKIIPMGAGLGGGSSDAAYTLIGLNELFNLKINVKELHHYASQLGSDCSFFLYQTPMIASGKGNILHRVKVSLSGYKLVVVYPEIHVNTAQAYSKLIPSEDRQPLEEIFQKEVAEWKNSLFNDFEETVIAKYPAIGEVKNKLYESGATYAAMSGSGSAVFGIFKNIPEDVNSLFPGKKVFVEK